MNDKVNLEKLNDIQKVWLCELSYVDITEKGHKKIIQEGLKIEELPKYIKNPTSPFCGDFFLGSEKFNLLSAIVLGRSHFPSKLDVVEALIKNGLGSLTIIHTTDFPKQAPSGFQALTFKDDFDNIGISYRGSDLYISYIVIREWLESNILEYFSNTSTQVNDALEYFLKHKSNTGNNYIFGHSLGGNLVSHVYLEYHSEIKQAFSINGTPINQKLIDTDAKKTAFNNKDKFSFNIVCGDVISQLKSCEIYKDNVNYIKNNNSMISSIFSAHLIQSSTFDEDGNFIKITESEMKKQTNGIIIKFINLSKFAREKMNKINFKLIKRNKNHKLIDNRTKKDDEINNVNIRKK